MKDDHDFMDIYENEEPYDANKGIFKKIGDQLYKMYKTVKAFIKKIIDAVVKFFRESRKKMKGLSNKQVVPDPYGYVDIIEGTRTTIVRYTEVCQELVDLDQNINNTINESMVGAAMHAMKKAIVNPNDNSQTYQLTKVEGCFREAEKYDRILDYALRKPMEPVKKPKRYRICDIQKQEETAFAPQIKTLRSLELMMDDQQKMYDNRSPSFRRFNKTHIARGQKILNTISNLLKRVSSFLLLYKELENQVIISAGNDPQAI